MSAIFVPAKSVEDWQGLLADPARQWKKAYSARTLAHCWQSAQGFPDEIMRAFQSSSIVALQSVTPLLIFPEYKVHLQGRGADSQNDIFVLAKTGSGDLLTMMVEGKVNESFGEKVDKWKARGQGLSDNKLDRLSYLQEQLGLSSIPDIIYYQLVHRCASVMIEARRFNASHALMLVHSFSPSAKRYPEYERFVQLFGIVAEKDRIQQINLIDGVALYAAWISGDPQFLEM